MPKLKRGTVWPQPAKMPLTAEQIEEIANGSMTYGQIKEEYGEEVVIEVGIARDPDTREWTDEDFSRAQPAEKAVPHIVEHWHRAQAKKEAMA